MISKKIFILALFAGITHAQGQVKLIEKVTKKSATDIVIPYERYKLPNGLTVILHEDHSDPIVHVDVTYHVGSAREEIGKSGFAHFFEHMMFQGSDNVGDEQHFKIITEAGGTLNGTTNRDRTNYFETVPNNQLEKMLWLEADRMGFLLDAVTQQKFEIQRATVKNERGQNYDNRPYGLVGETIAKNLYPYGHPYSWLTIGYIEDLNRVDVQDLKNFFLRWYGPNNAVLTIGGDFNKTQVLKLVQKYFGSIPRGPEVKKMKLDAPVINSDRYVTMTDNYAKNQMLNIVMPTVPRGHKDENALDCLAQILGGDNNSILYQNLVKTQKATRASASNPTDELAGNLQFSVMPAGKYTLAQMEQEVRNAIKEFETRGVKDEDIKKFVASNQANFISSLESVSSKVSTLASSYTFFDNPNHAALAYKELSKLTKADVMNAYNKYVKGKNMLILNVLTKDKQEGRAGQDNYTVDESVNRFEKIDYTGLVYNKAKDTFDRSVMPKSGANPVIKIPKFTLKEKIAPGNYKMLSSLQTEIPSVSIEIALPGGSILEQNMLEKYGVSNIFMQMMEEGTQKHTAEEISDMLSKLGSDISFVSTTDHYKIYVNSLSKNIKPTLAILEEMLLQPKFEEETLNRIKNQSISGLKNVKQNPSALADRLYSAVLYGTNNYFGKSVSDKSIEAIEMSDIRNLYNNITGKDAQITVVGSYTPADLTQLLNVVKKIPLKRLNNKPDIKISPREREQDGKKIIYLADVPGAAQTEFRIGYLPTIKYDPLGEYYKATLMNFAVGGNFNSRVNLNLREDKGWTYGARSGFSNNNHFTRFTFSSGIKKESSDSALVEVLKELNNYAQSGIKADELSFMKSAIGQSEARKYETLGQKVGFYSNMMEYGLPKDYTTQQNKITQNISATQINNLARTYLNEDNYYIVLAGDGAYLKERLEKLGYKIVQLDWLGEAVK